MAAIGVSTSADANRKAKSIHSMDRKSLQSTLGVLGTQYVQFGVKEAFDYANTGTWTLRPGDPKDQDRLRAFTARSAFFGHGAALTDLRGAPINGFANPPGFPSATDEGFGPMREGLAAGKPGISGVMDASGAPLVAFGVPVNVRGAPAAIFVAYWRADRSPLQTYNERLTFGKTGRAYMVDALGNVIASSSRTMVGRAAPASPALSNVRAGRSGFLDFDRGGTRFVASYAALGTAGWGEITEQTAAEFFGPIESGGRRVVLALVAFLGIAAAGLALLNQKRQEALRRAYVYKGELLANTTHELKTPLTAIRGAALTLGTRWRDMTPHQVDMFLGMIHRRCDGLAKLIERILQGARLEAGREIAIHPEPVEVGGVLRQMKAEFEDASPRHHLKLAAPKGVWVKADPQSLDQVLGLLIENAIKYSPNGGDVRVQARPHDGAVVFSVADAGLGMDEQTRRQIFEPYFKAARGDASRFDGVGLGLSISRHLVRRHGGDIWVDSKPNAGSTFSFTLPRTEMPQPVAKPAGRRKVGASA
jgi:signal transduction histidine kinase